MKKDILFSGFILSWTHITTINKWRIVCCGYWVLSRPSVWEDYGTLAGERERQLSPLGTVTLQVQSECPLPTFCDPHSSTVAGCPGSRASEIGAAWPGPGPSVSSEAGDINIKNIISTVIVIYGRYIINIHSQFMWNTSRTDVFLSTTFGKVLDSMKKSNINELFQNLKSLDNLNWYRIREYFVPRRFT